MAETSKDEDNVAKLSRLLREMQTTGRVDPALEGIVRQIAGNPQQLMELIRTDPEGAERLMQLLKTVGATEAGGRPILNSEDYYRDGPSKFKLRWPVDSILSLPVPFDQLDRQTQFHVLFTEWVRREAQGAAERNGGQLDAAEQIFRECLERARQLEIAELEARSYEGLMSVEQKRGDRQAEQKWLRAAQEARAAG